MFYLHQGIFITVSIFHIAAMDAYSKLSEVGVILFQGTQYEMCIQVLEAAQQFQTNQKGITMRILLTLANAKSKLGLWQQAISLYQECLTIAVATHEQVCVKKCFYKAQKYSVCVFAQTWLVIMSGCDQAVIYLG